MKNYIFLILLLPIAVFAQEVDTVLLNSRHQVIQEDVDFSFLRTYKKITENAWRRKTYYKTGELQETGLVIGIERTTRFGDYLTFYKNGEKEYHKNYKGDTTLYLQHWDSLGNPSLINGEGTIEEAQKNGSTLFEIKEHKLKSVYQLDDEFGRIYNLLDEKPDYKGGIKTFYGDISLKISYPREARRNGTQGRVYVEFIVDPNGNITRAKVVKGIGSGCDEEALSAILKVNKWIPGSHNGVNRAARMILPVYFKLND